MVKTAPVQVLILYNQLLINQKPEVNFQIPEKPGAQKETPVDINSTGVSIFSFGFSVTVQAFFQGSGEQSGLYVSGRSRAAWQTA